MPRPQFTLKTLLWLMVVVASFCGGAAWQRRRYMAERSLWFIQRRDLLSVLRGAVDNQQWLSDERQRLRHELYELKQPKGVTR